MSVNSDLKFINYGVPKFKAEINQKFDFATKQNITLNPKFTRDIIKIDDKQFQTQLTIVIENTPEQEVPFNIEASIKGLFALEDWQNEDNKDLVEITSTATLFPYLRSLVSNLSTMLNMPPYILPLININELFKN